MPMPVKRRVLSFSLYGTEKKYINGAIENAKLAKIYYVGWVVVIHVSAHIDEDVLCKLREHNVEIVVMDYPENATAMLWRWLPFLDMANEMRSHSNETRISEGVIKARIKMERQLKLRALNVMKKHELVEKRVIKK